MDSSELEAREHCHPPFLGAPALVGLDVERPAEIDPRVGEGLAHVAPLDGPELWKGCHDLLEGFGKSSSASLASPNNSFGFLSQVV